MNSDDGFETGRDRTMRVHNDKKLRRTVTDRKAMSYEGTVYDDRKMSCVRGHVHGACYNSNWFAVFRFNATLTVNTNTTFLYKATDYFSHMLLQRWDAGKKVHLNRRSNSQSTGHESDTLNTEPPGRDTGFSRVPIKI